MSDKKIIERLYEYFMRKGIPPTRVEKNAGLSNGYLGTQHKRNADLGESAINKIIDYCQLDPGWVLRGNGLPDRLSQIIIDLEYEKLENIAQLLGIESQELAEFTNNFIFPSKPFDFVSFIKEYPEYNYPWILTGIGDRFNIDEKAALAAIKQRIYEKNHPEYFHKENEPVATRVNPEDMIPGKPSGIPLIPYAAFAGYGSESFQDLVVEDYYIVREFKDADFLLRIKGDSMSPKFAGGDVVACRLVDGLTFWQWHKIYAICTRTQGILIKRVEEYPGNPAFITCCSDNPQYKPFQIHEDEIIAIALVLGAIVIE